MIETVSEPVWRRARCDFGQCVEVATVSGAVAIRDSKNPDGPVLTYTAPAWQSLLAAVKAGTGHERVSDMPGGEVCLTDARLAHLHFTAAEWDAFVAGVRNGEFDSV